MAAHRKVLESLQYGGKELEEGVPARQREGSSEGRSEGHRRVWQGAGWRAPLVTKLEADMSEAWRVVQSGTIMH